MRYNNNLENTETESNRDEIEEEKTYNQNDVIEEEPTVPEDDDFQWISREEVGFKKLRKRETQAPLGSEECLEEKDERFAAEQPFTRMR